MRIRTLAALAALLLFVGARVPAATTTFPVDELRPGMVLARSIYTANGLLLFPDGQRLTETFIDRLNCLHRLDPIAESLLVYS